MGRHEDLLLQRITADPKVMVGKLTIRGLRIAVARVLRALASGVTGVGLLRDYPELQPADIRVALLCAAEAVRRDQTRRAAAKA